MTLSFVMVFRVVELQCSCSVTRWNTYTPARRFSLHCELIGVSNCLTLDFNCLLITSCSLTVRLLTFSASAVVLAGAFCFVCCRALALLSATSFAACLNCGFFRCNRSGFFNGLVLLNFLLHLLLFLCCCCSSDFLAVCTLSFISAAFFSSVAFLDIFCFGVSSHRFDSVDFASARTWFSLSSHPSPSTPRPSWTCASLVAVLSISSVLLSVRVSDFVLLCSLGFLAAHIVC